MGNATLSLIVLYQAMQICAFDHHTSRSFLGHLGDNTWALRVLRLLAMDRQFRAYQRFHFWGRRLGPKASFIKKQRLTYKLVDLASPYENLTFLTLQSWRILCRRSPLLYSQPCDPPNRRCFLLRLPRVRQGIARRGLSRCLLDITISISADMNFF